MRKTETSIQKGSVRELVPIALPMVVSFACDTVMTFTDRVFLSQLSPELMNAAMVGGISAFVMLTFVIGLTGYSTALIAQYLGSGQKNRCALTLTQAVLIALVAYPLIVVCKPAAHALFAASSISTEQLGPQVVYFDLLVNLCVFGLLRHCLSSFFSGIGRTRWVMAAAVTTMSVNVLVNYVLIFGKFGMPAMGIRGAACGTIVGAASGVGVLLVAYLRRSNVQEFAIKHSLHFDKAVMGTLLRFGYPAGVELFLNLVAFDALIIGFHAVGGVAATAATIVFNWDMVSFVPLLGIEIGVTSLVGRYMGARDPDTAYKAALSGLKIGLIYSSVILLLFAGLPHYLVDFFRTPGADSMFLQARPLAISMIRIASLYVLVQALLVVFVGTLRGAGDTRWAMIFTVSVHWVLMLLCVYLLHGLHWPPERSWLVLVLGFIAACGVLYRRFQAGQWKTIQVIPSTSDSVARIHESFHEGADL